MRSTLEKHQEHLGKRFKEHLKAPSPIHDHSNTLGHTTTLDNFKVVGREEQNLSRLIKRIHVHKSQWSIPQQEHRQIPSASYVG